MKKSGILHLVFLGLLLPALSNCTSMNKSHVGAFAGGSSATAGCTALGVSDPYIIGTCAVVGAFKGADLLYNSDKDVHNAVFVDHLNTSPSYGQSYSNWYNQKTGNSGNIKVVRTYTQGPIKCKDYNSTVDITNSWPLVGIGGVNRSMTFGTACQLPDGQWIEKP